jgi:hypothetical protein
MLTLYSVLVADNECREAVYHSLFQQGVVPAHCNHEPTRQRGTVCVIRL